jgi:cytochrome oxidase Cu insertion factor (SCO1/SenC/PrrC family)
MTRATRNGLIAFIVVLIVLLGGFAYRQITGADDAAQSPVPIGGPFTLTDQNGVVRHDSDFHGKPTLIYFGYTFCPDVCPTTLTMMSDALAKLGPDAARFTPIFITVDPARDTPLQLKQYMESFDRRFIALTGSDAQIKQVAAEYRVYYRKVAGDNPKQYTMDHSSVIYLMGGDGNYVGHFLTTISADELAQGLRKYK